MELNFDTLLPLLAAHNVSSFRCDGLEINFRETKAQEPNKFVQVPDAISNMPPDLKANDDMSFDRILNWSTGGESEGLPLTGDKPLNEAL